MVGADQATQNQTHAALGQVVQLGGLGMAGFEQHLHPRSPLVEESRTERRAEILKKQLFENLDIGKHWAKESGFSHKLRFLLTVLHQMRSADAPGTSSS